MTDKPKRRKRVQLVRLESAPPKPKRKPEWKPIGSITPIRRPTS